MVPHPVTWLNARELEHQDLLAAAERHGRESMALAAPAWHRPGIRSRLRRAAARRTRPALPTTAPDIRIRGPLHRGPRLITRLRWVTGDG